MPRHDGLRAARALGVTAGLTAAAAVLLAGRPDPQAPRLGAAVTVRAASAGAIEVGRSGGLVLAAASLRPGDPPAYGSVSLRNRSEAAYRVSLKPSLAPGLAPDEVGADPDAARAAGEHLLELAIGSGSNRAEGTVAELASAPGPGIVIPAGSVRSLPVSAAVPPGSPSLAGEIVSLQLRPVREPVR